MQDCADVEVGQAQADQKVVQKSVYFAKRSVLTVRLLRCVRPADPAELLLLFCLKIPFNT